MVVAKVVVSGTTLNVAWCHKIPKGIVGAKVEIEYADDSWSELNRTVVFQSTVTKDIINAGTIVTIPPEVVTSTGATLFMGIFGTDADNVVAIPTAWVALGVIQGAADPSGDTSTDPTLPVWAQMERRFEKLMHLADNHQATVSASDWAASETDPGYIKNRTHWVESSDVIEFDGDITRKEAFLMDDNTYLVKVSDCILTSNELVGASVTVYTQGEEPEEMTIEITESQVSDMSANGIPAITAGNAVFSLLRDYEEDGISAKAGLYFLCVIVNGTPVAYVKQISCLSGINEVIHKLDNKYLDLGWLPKYQHGSEVLLEESTQYFNGKFCQQDFYFKLQTGKQYSVTWDDVTYSCYAKAELEGLWGVIYIGNRYLHSSSYEDTGEPFCVISSVVTNILLRTDILASGDATEHKCSISITDVIANRIPVEFMPQSFTMPTDLGKNTIVNAELVRAYAAFQNGAPVCIQYNNSLFRVLSISCDLIDAMYDHICMTDGEKIMIWHRNRGWTEYGQKSFVLATMNYYQRGNTPEQGKKYRFTVDESGALVSEDVTGTM